MKGYKSHWNRLKVIGRCLYCSWESAEKTNQSYKMVPCDMSQTLAETSGT